MKFKKFVLTFLILCIVLTLPACSKSGQKTVAVTVGNASVDEAIFTYYLDSKIPAKGEKPDKSEVIAAAEQLSAHYVFVNTEFEKLGLKLSSGEKGTLAAEVEDVWNLYGKYYENIGISKDVITKIKTSEAYENSLINSIYGSGGSNEVSSEELKAYFNDNYIFFKVINAYLTGDAEDDASLKKTFEGLEEEIDDDTSIDKVNVEYVESIGGSTADTMQVSYMKKGTDTYPDGFFEAVKALENKDTKVLTYDEFIFLVQKCNSDDYFSDYKSTILNDLTSENLVTYLNDLYKDQATAGITDIETDCYNTIIKNKLK